MYNPAMTRFRRKVIACISIAALFLAQLAIAGYACPIERASHHPMTMKSAASDTAPPCRSLDSKNPTLCKQHCEDSSQSVDNHIQAQVDAPILPVIVTHFLPPAQIFKRSPVPRVWLSKCTKPPLYLHHCSFLI